MKKPRVQLPFEELRDHRLPRICGGRLVIPKAAPDREEKRVFLRPALSRSVDGLPMNSTKRDRH